MPSFDVVSEVDIHELQNAIDQAKREIATRYDFRGSKSEIALEDLLIKLTADDQMKIKALQEIVKQKLAKRGISLKSVTFKDPQPAGGDLIKQEVVVKQGLTQDELKRINKSVKETKMKVSGQIQGDQLRISGKKRDDLQDVISFLKDNITDLELQYTNFRD